MCLNLKSERQLAEIAQEDIKVFKVVIRHVDVDGQHTGYHAPFRPFKYTLDTTIKSELVSGWNFGSPSVGKGLHTVATDKDAQELEEYLMNFGDPLALYETLEATIPKGSKYYTGVFKLGMFYDPETPTVNSIASNALIIHSPEGFTPCVLT